MKKHPILKAKFNYVYQSQGNEIVLSTATRDENIKIQLLVTTIHFQITSQQLADYLNVANGSAVTPGAFMSDVTSCLIQRIKSN